MTFFKILLMAFIQTCHKTLVQHKTVALLAKALLNQAKQSFWFVNFCIKKNSLKSFIKKYYRGPPVNSYLYS